MQAPVCCVNSFSTAVNAADRLPAWSMMSEAWMGAQFDCAWAGRPATRTTAAKQQRVSFSLACRVMLPSILEIYGLPT